MIQFSKIYFPTTMISLPFPQISNQSPNDTEKSINRNIFDHRSIRLITVGVCVYKLVSNKWGSLFNLTHDPLDPRTMDTIQ